MSDTGVPLIARSEFASTDPDETREYLDQVYGWRMAAQQPGRPGTPLTISMTDAHEVSTARAVAPGSLSYRVLGGDFFVFDTLLDGTFELEHNTADRRYGPGDVFIANHPNAEFVASTRDIEVITTILPSRVLDEVASTDPDNDPAPVRFLDDTPVGGNGRQWRAACRYVETLLTDPEVEPSPLLIGAAARQLAAVALINFPNSVVARAARHESRDAHPRTLRQAIAFIESHVEADITLADIARAAAVSPRAVQLAFRNHLDTTPMAYLRRVRLDHAHADLLAAVPNDGTTVTAIAARWGFFGPSRFAADYRAAYGRLPSQTLQGISDS